MKAIRLKVKREAYPWLNAAAIEVNQVWNWAAEYTQSRIRNGLSAPAGYDLNYLAQGWSAGFERINCDTIQQVLQHYSQKRRIASKVRLRWRVSAGSRRSLGWVPVKRSNIKHKGASFRFCGKAFRVFEMERLKDWRSGSFAQDAVGDWWLCLAINAQEAESVAPQESVGIDLGLKSIAVTSDGDVLKAGKWTHTFSESLANAQRRGHKLHAKRIHRKAARCRADALHKFSRKIVDQYQKIVVGDVSSQKLVRTRMAKSVLDSGWGMLKAQLQYKGEHAGRCVHIVNERNTTRACSSCGCLSGPSGLRQLDVRQWTCVECGATHDRDVNSARNILAVARYRPSISGNDGLSSKPMSAGKQSRGYL